MHRVRKKQTDDLINGSIRRATQSKHVQDKVGRYSFGWYDYLQNLGSHEGKDSSNLTAKAKKRNNMTKNPASEESRSHRGKYGPSHDTSRYSEPGDSQDRKGKLAVAMVNKLEPGESTGHLCGDAAPEPIITKASKVTIKLFSDTKVDPGRLGFTLQYQISKYIILLM